MTEDSAFCLFVTKQDGYFLTTCQGEVTLRGVLDGWGSLAKRCFDEGIDRLICQPHVPGPTEFLDVYQFGHGFREITWPEGMKIAIVCEQDDLAKYRLAEAMVGHLRGPESRIFTSPEDAKDWLLDRAQDVTST